MMGMRALAEKVTLEQFRTSYADAKPYYELLDGEAIQKAVPTNPHATLQFALALKLGELGFRPKTELTLAISQNWEPTPDVCGLLGPLGGQPYPTSALPVVIEILSPGDPLTRVIQKCRRYGQWGVADILVFDPLGREAWHWDTAADSLVKIRSVYSFKSKPVELVLADVFQRLDADL